LRDRPEEIPFLLQLEVERTAPGLAVHVSLVEAALLRPWPGNVRELLAEARGAAQAATAAKSSRVEATHLSPTAGCAFERPAEPAPLAPAGSPPEITPPAGAPPPSRAHIAGLLKRVGGNVSAAARELGVHRTQLRRWMERYGLDARGSGATRGEG
jgi:transcriptional regulator with GAF, ATPase, and Fis domain